VNPATTLLIAAALPLGARLAPGGGNPLAPNPFFTPSRSVITAAAAAARPLVARLRRWIRFPAGGSAFPGRPSRLGVAVPVRLVVSIPAASRGLIPAARRGLILAASRGSSLSPASCPRVVARQRTSSAPPSRFGAPPLLCSSLRPPVAAPPGTARRGHLRPAVRPSPAARGSMSSAAPTHPPVACCPVLLVLHLLCSAAGSRPPAHASADVAAIHVVLANCFYSICKFAAYSLEANFLNSIASLSIHP